MNASEPQAAAAIAKARESLGDDSTSEIRVCARIWDEASPQERRLFLMPGMEMLNHQTWASLHYDDRKIVIARMRRFSVWAWKIALAFRQSEMGVNELAGRLG